jgi:ribosome-associated protein
MSDQIIITPTLSIPGSELRFRFSRSGGPGGQNVNKVSSRVEVLFSIEDSPSLSEAQKHRLLTRLAGRLDSDGILYVQVDESRSQWQNRQIAVERLASILRNALKVPKRRVATRRTQASHSRRLQAKKKRGELKRGRKDAGRD